MSLSYSYNTLLSEVSLSGVTVADPRSKKGVSGSSDDEICRKLVIFLGFTMLFSSKRESGNQDLPICPSLYQVQSKEKAANLDDGDGMQLPCRLKLEGDRSIERQLAEQSRYELRSFFF